MPPEQPFRRRKDDNVALFPANDGDSVGSPVSVVDDRAKEFGEGITKQKRENMRGWITIGIIGAYIVGIVGMALIIGIQSFWVTADELGKYVAALGPVMDNLSKSMMPIITLALGFYFVSEK